MAPIGPLTPAAGVTATRPETAPDAPPSIDGFPVEVTGAYPTLVFVAHDEPGIVAAVSTLLAREGDNIATMRVSRRAKGGQAIHIYELDAPASAGANSCRRSRVRV